jgi:hypothetical protein
MQRVRQTVMVVLVHFYGGVSVLIDFLKNFARKKLNFVIKIRGFAGCVGNFVTLPNGITDLAVNLYCCCDLGTNTVSDGTVDPSAGELCCTVVSNCALRLR